MQKSQIDPSSGRIPWIHCTIFLFFPIFVHHRCFMLNKLPLPSGLTCFTSNYRDTRVNPRRKNFPARNDTQIYLVVVG